MDVAAAPENEGCDDCSGGSLGFLETGAPHPNDGQAQGQSDLERS